MPIFPVNGVRYHVEVRGNGGPSGTILLLHGFTGSAANWDQIGAALQVSYPCRVVTVDLLGHGLTDSPDDPARYRMEDAAADLAALVESLHVAPVHLLGYSMGGRLALCMALCYPGLIRSLVLESASPGLALESERQARRATDEALADRIERNGMAAFVDYWEALPLFAPQQRLTDAVRGALRAQRLQNNPRGLANSLRGMGTGIQPSMWESLDRLQVPALLLAGALDPKFTAIARQMHARIPGSTLAIIPDAGHTIHLERPETYVSYLSAWLKSE